MYACGDTIGMLERMARTELSLHNSCIHLLYLLLRFIQRFSILAVSSIYTHCSNVFTTVDDTVSQREKVLFDP